MWVVSVARQTSTTVTEVIEIFDEYVQIDRKPLSTVICIDEFYFSSKSKNKYACLLINFKNRLVLDVLESRKKSYLRSCFRSIPIDEREKIQYISMDMYDNYRDIARVYLPNATICVDSFHVIKNINEALDKIRINVMNRYKVNKTSDEHYLLKSKCKLLFIDSTKISDEHFHYNHHFHRKVSNGQLLEYMLNVDKRLKEAYELKEDYSVFNESKDSIEDLDRQLEAIINEYLLSHIDGFISIGNTLRNWKKEILNSFSTYEGRRINNGPIEGRNKYIKILIGLANGFRNFKRFRNRVLYIFNKFEAPSDHPKDSKYIKLPGKERGKYNKKQ